MDNFSEALSRIETGALRSFLATLRAPCYESELFKIAFPGAPISGSHTLELYRRHFLLFHVLYRLQEAFYSEQKYLHVHFMRIFLTDYPPPGRCRFYEEHSGRFCAEPCAQNGPGCVFHQRQVGEAALEETSQKYFYLDSENYARLDETTAEAFINGTWQALLQYDRYNDCFAVLDLPQSADTGMIKRRFRELAKKYHPDLGNHSPERFNEINRAYRFLMQVRATG